MESCWWRSGYFDSANMFHRLFSRELTDPVMMAIYKGSWGTTFLYFFGYLLVAYNPLRHTGVVILNTILRGLRANFRPTAVRLL